MCVVDLSHHLRRSHAPVPDRFGPGPPARRCALIGWDLNTLAKTVGGLWFAVGIIDIAVTTRGFRLTPKIIDFNES